MANMVEYDFESVFYGLTTIYANVILCYDASNMNVPQDDSATFRITVAELRWRDGFYVVASTEHIRNVSVL